MKVSVKVKLKAKANCITPLVQVLTNELTLKLRLYLNV